MVVYQAQLLVVKLKIMKSKFLDNNLKISYKLLILIGLIFGVKALCNSFIIFNDNINSLGQNNQWKFYASFIGFFLFLILFITLIVVIIIKIKKNNVN